MNIGLGMLLFTFLYRYEGNELRMPIAELQEETRRLVLDQNRAGHI